MLASTLADAMWQACTLHCCMGRGRAFARRETDALGCRKVLPGVLFFRRKKTARTAQPTLPCRGKCILVSRGKARRPFGRRAFRKNGMETSDWCPVRRGTQMRGLQASVRKCPNGRIVPAVHVRGRARYASRIYLQAFLASRTARLSAFISVRFVSRVAL